MCLLFFLRELMNLLGPKFGPMKSVSLEKRSLACLWFLGNTETFRSVADRFGMSKETLHFLLAQFNGIFKSHKFLNTFISWPTTDVELSNLAEKFSQRAGFPDAVGAIDGTYIPISGPSEYRDSYICRKGFAAMHLQAVCGPDLKFLDVFSAYPGSVHDTRVYRNSPLFQVLQDLPPKFHLLGDSAYPLSTSLLTPYRDNGHLTLEEKRYNSAHSSTRVDIERAFGLLKGKFRKLKFLDMRHVEDIPSTILTCCALHNFILMDESLDESEVVLECVSENVQCENDARESLSGQRKRQDMHVLT
ncbi:uncharacterized protein LOC134250044 [Saccostrea cucullata]|uniref:uncharacterized protein LOC134250044 n=1 Tax=Saccostrea cuccullata TaxID=36930 RepID=UPI002ED0246F